MVAPRVNAAGRMATADIATRLLLASDEALAGEAQALAQQLDAENTRRRDEEAGHRGRGAQGGRDRPRRRRAHRCWSSAGRAGTAASSASSPRSSSTPTTGRPSCCRSNTAWPTARAAASPASTSWPRSSRARRCCSRFGGHKQAAGLQLGGRRHPGVPARRERLRACDRLGPDDLRPQPASRRAARLRRASRRRSCEHLMAMAPFGLGNPEAALHAPRPIEVVDGPRRLKERHLKMSLRQRGRTFRAIAWNAVEKEPVIAGAGGGARGRLRARTERVQRQHLHRTAPLGRPARPSADRAPCAGRWRYPSPWVEDLSMTSWQRRARLLAGVVAICGGAAGAYWLTGGPPHGRRRRRR